MTTSAVNFDALSALGLTGSGASTQEERNKLGQEDFLKLMTTQLTNQDPFKPLESGDFLGQIAQFSTVSGIQDLQASFAEISSALISNQMLDASTLVGREVLVPSNVAWYTPGAAVTGNVVVPSSVSDLTVSVYDLSGQLVRRIGLGTQTAGNVGFSWDGTADDGRPLTAGLYVVRADAIGSSGAEALETWTEARVASVTLGAPGEGLVVNLEGLGAIGFEEIKEIR